MVTNLGRRTVRPPYAPLKGVKDFFEKAATKAPPSSIDREYLTSLGVAANNEQHLVAALKFLGLIDEAGRPTEQFRILYLKGPDRKRGLQNLLRVAYPGPFAGELDPQVASRDETHDYFVHKYGLHGQMARKAASLFLTLCSFAGITTFLDTTKGNLPIERPKESGAKRAPYPVSGHAPVEGSLVQKGVVSMGGWPILAMITPEMSEEDIAGFLRRVKRAIATVDGEA